MVGPHHGGNRPVYAPEKCQRHSGALEPRDKRELLQQGFIHIEEYECEARDTKLGKEEIKIVSGWKLSREEADCLAE